MIPINHSFIQQSAHYKNKHILNHYSELLQSQPGIKSIADVVSLPEQINMALDIW